MPAIGIEPIRYFYHGILSPARLPVPPRRLKPVLAHFRNPANHSNQCYRTMFSWWSLSLYKLLRACALSQFGSHLTLPLPHGSSAYVGTCRLMSDSHSQQHFCRLRISSCYRTPEILQTTQTRAIALCFRG